MSWWRRRSRKPRKTVRGPTRPRRDPRNCATRTCWPPSGRMRRGWRRLRASAHISRWRRMRNSATWTAEVGWCANTQKRPNSRGKSARKFVDSSWGRCAKSRAKTREIRRLFAMASRGIRESTSSPSSRIAKWTRPRKIRTRRPTWSPKVWWGREISPALISRLRVAPFPQRGKIPLPPEFRPRRGLWTCRAENASRKSETPKNVNIALLESEDVKSVTLSVSLNNFSLDNMTENNKTTWTDEIQESWKNATDNWIN